MIDGLPDTIFFDIVSTCMELLSHYMFLNQKLRAFIALIINAAPFCFNYH